MDLLFDIDDKETDTCIVLLDDDLLCAVLFNHVIPTTLVILAVEEDVLFAFDDIGISFESTALADELLLPVLNKARLSVMAALVFELLLMDVLKALVSLITAIALELLLTTEDNIPCEADVKIAVADDVLFAVLVSALLSFNVAVDDELDLTVDDNLIWAPVVNVAVDVLLLFTELLNDCVSFIVLFWLDVLLTVEESGTFVELLTHVPPVKVAFLPFPLWSRTVPVDIS